jgi:hypothetical protein
MRSSSCVLLPPIQRPFAEPVSAPPLAPCMRHTDHPFTAGDLHIVRVDFAVAVAHGRAPEALSGVYLGTVYAPIALAPGETFRQTTRWRFKR